MTGKVIAKYGGTGSINVTQSSNTTGNAFLAHVELDDSENDDLESKVAVAIALTTMVGIWQVKFLASYTVTYSSTLDT